MQSVLSFNQVEFGWLKDKTDLKVKQISFQESSKYFIYGPSGSGKSTLLNLLTGFIKPNKGEILLFSKDITKLSDRQLNKFRATHMGFVFQSFNLIPYLTAEENIKLPLKFLKKAPAFDLNKMVTKLNLHDCLKMKTELLSHGEQQRVALLKALISSPEILVCDEPTSALDSEVESQFFEVLFSDLCKDMTIIFVSHNMSLKDKFDHQLSIEVFKDV
ncbi:MAG: ATP-binding cassette domain-containing protein [Bdellovibrionales bacterium]|nr:ATP-binding cassette domain-containing protein [Bdellovibrionales bacterium]